MTNNDGSLPEDLFRRGLSRFLPQLNDPLLETTILREGAFREISRLLMDYGKYEWGLRPRTFSILWMLEIPNQMDEFIEDERTDFSLPYNDNNLPDIIKGVKMRNKFLRLQQLVRCPSEQGIKELEEGGKHIQLPKNVDCYFESVKPLGRGRFGEVDEVLSLQTLKRYARKQIRRGHTVFDDKAQLKSFERELKSLKAVSHRHIVKLVGSYTESNTDSTTLGLIMDPVAEMDLQQFIDCLPRQGKSLRIFFGCLATALAYIHQKNIRHKDIKPSNILIKGGLVMLADFGTSRVCLDENLTTCGETRQGTPRYRAPEVADGADRNTASDIWSLGCVFLEMATVLSGRTLDKMHEFYSEQGTLSYKRIYQNDIATSLWISEMRGTGLAVDCNVLSWTEWMLQRDPNERPTAAQVRNKILGTASEVEYICNFCASNKGLEHSTYEATGSAPINPPAGVGSPSQNSNLLVPVEDGELSDKTIEGEKYDCESAIDQDVPMTGRELIEYPKPGKGRVLDRYDSDIEPDPICFPSSPPHAFPRASYVPSYLHASTNQLSAGDIEVIAHDPANIFVYGRLMFPTIIYAIASHSLRGVYSPQLRRRLMPTSEDWANADRSIQNATRLMTPALLRGYSRRTLGYSNFPVIQKDISRHKVGRRRYAGSYKAPKKVTGFLISGITKEAMHYLDLLFESTERNLIGMKPIDASQYEPKSPLHRRSVEVEVKLDTGDVSTITVYAYALKSENFDLNDSTPWNPDQFVFSPTFQTILRHMPSTCQEEEEIAIQLGVSYPLVGSTLCKIILGDDVEELDHLLQRNSDPDSYCSIYGSPLHVAAALDKGKIVKILINYGANVNANIGPYGTPLIISAKASRNSMVRLLLENGANVLDTHPEEVNALYQAVAHSNYDMVELLLENGAWLLEGWHEICDLAKERGEGSIISLLRRYDVREKHRWYCIATSDEPRGSEISSLRIKATVATNSVIMRGNWKGKKGVEIVAKALNAGASISILDSLRDNFGSFMPSLDRFMLALKGEHGR